MKKFLSILIIASFIPLLLVAQKPPRGPMPKIEPLPNLHGVYNYNLPNNYKVNLFIGTPIDKIIDQDLKNALEYAEKAGEMTVTTSATPGVTTVTPGTTTTVIPTEGTPAVTTATNPTSITTTGEKVKALESVSIAWLALITGAQATEADLQSARTNLSALASTFINGFTYTVTLHSGKVASVNYSSTGDVSGFQDNGVETIVLDKATVLKFNAIYPTGLPVSAETQEKISKGTPVVGTIRLSLTKNQFTIPSIQVMMLDKIFQNKAIKYQKDEPITVNGSGWVTDIFDVELKKVNDEVIVIMTVAMRMVEFDKLINELDYRFEYYQAKMNNGNLRVLSGIQDLERGYNLYK